MPSDELYLKLAEALSQPSKAYRAAQAGLDIPRQAIEGYKYGAELSDSIRNRRLQRQTLGEALGGMVPEELQGLPVDQARNLVPLALAKSQLDRANRPEKQQMPGSLDAILADRVNKGELSMENAAKIKRSFSPSIIEKPPTGYEKVPGGLRPTPGGPAALKIEGLEKKAKAGQQAALEQSKLITSSIDKAIGQSGKLSTGFIGGLTKEIGGTPAKNLNKTLAAIRSNIGIETIQNMRNNSPTGGALGQVSDRDIELLTSARGALDQEQTEEQLDETLAQIKKHYSNVTLAIESQTGDLEADNAIAQVIASEAPEAEKRARIQGIRSVAGL